MTRDQITEFPLPPLADDAVLLLWRVASMQEEALDVVAAWGFVPKAEIIWVKTARRGSRIPLMGMGRTVRNCHETAILATRGKPKKTSSSELSVVFSPRLAHSRKPEAVYRLIERLYPGPYCELFSRRQRPGWACDGIEMEGSEAK
jgi:N6-adenosine-specific RNA methylase IME4